ncbi:MAG: hypothetical protein KTR25_11330 [Myxococcales bacterium]|nr:hypothetical protein [Myxococcales bacterium]
MSKFFGSRQQPYSFAAPLHALRERSLTASTLLRIFYAFPIFWYVTHLQSFSPLLQPIPVELVWSSKWLLLMDRQTGAAFVLLSGILSASVALLFPEKRFVRVWLFISLFQILSLKYSFGKIHHLMHGWVYTSFILAFFLPNESFFPQGSGRATQHRTMLVFHACTTMLGITYGLAGLGKLLGTVYQTALWQITPLHPSALARHIADRLLQTFPDSILGGWMINYGVWLWPAMLGTVYLQLFAVHAAFRPQLHRLWGFGLSCFHLITALTMTIDFSPNLALLGIFFVASPFAPAKFNIMAIIRELPIFGYIFTHFYSYRSKSST